MPIINFTVPDSSPWITYSPVGAWGDSDAATQDYTNQTFHFTSVKGAAANFNFNGTAVYLYGALRGNHDLYTVTVDSSNTTANGHTDDPVGVFNHSLFASASLTNGLHSVALTNTPNNTGFVDLDWAVITVGDGNTNTISNDFWLDDSSANFTYDSAWTAPTNGFSSEYFNSSFHVSNTVGGKATLNFFGNAVALYGAASTNHGPYSVSLDGASPQNFNGSQVTFRPQQLLYYASSLPIGMHTLVIANQDASTFTDIDYAVVSRWDATTQLPGALGSTASSTLAGSGSSSASPATRSGVTTVHSTATVGSTETSTGQPLNPTSSNALVTKSNVWVLALALLPLLVGI